MGRRAADMQAINTRLQKGRKSTQRERLLAGVLAAANRDGYARANVSVVIAEAGVSRPTFYEYFSDKDDCFVAALADIAERLLEDVRRAVEGQAPEHALQAAIAALLRFASSQPAPARFLMGEAMAGGPRALGARDQGIAEIAQIIEEAQEQLPPDTATPDISGRALIGAIYRLLASRLRRGLHGMSGLHEGLLGWISSYEQPCGERRWRALQPLAPPARPPLQPDGRLRAPMALPPGRPRLSDEEVAENHRQRILFAAAGVAMTGGYTATTIAEITKCAGLDRRAFYALFKDKHDAFMALHEFGFQHVLAVTAGGFFSGDSWPERVWEGARALTQFVENNLTIAYVGWVEAYAVGPGAVQRVEDSLHAFTVFLREGYEYEPKQDPPSPLALEAIVTTIFEIVYKQARESASPQTSGLLPHVTYLCLAPFIGPVKANKFIDQKLSAGRDG
jgi:AcrR family transcriptional regulator